MFTKHERGKKMLTFKKILAPVDLSEASPKLAPYILTMAAKFDAEIHLLFVARLLQYFTGFNINYSSIVDFEKALLDGAEQQLNEFKNEYFEPWTKTKSVVILGDIPDEIINYITTAEIDMMIMGTHGRKGLDRVVFGSVADRVIKASPVPVFIVNPYRTNTDISSQAQVLMLNNI
jgi:nucleotide-binding universal stress UspA family protein